QRLEGDRSEPGSAREQVAHFPSSGARMAARAPRREPTMRWIDGVVVCLALAGGRRARRWTPGQWRGTSMNNRLRARYVISALSVVLWPGVGRAQMHLHHPAAADTTHHATHESMPGMDMSGMDMGEMPMSGMYGPYAMSREASGTSWQP